MQRKKVNMQALEIKKSPLTAIIWLFNKSYLQKVNNSDSINQFFISHFPLRIISLTCLFIN